MLYCPWSHLPLSVVCRRRFLRQLTSIDECIFSFPRVEGVSSGQMQSPSRFGARVLLPSPFFKLMECNFHKPASWTVGDIHISAFATCDGSSNAYSYCEDIYKAIMGSFFLGYIVYYISIHNKMMEVISWEIFVIQPQFRELMELIQAKAITPPYLFIYILLQCVE